MLDLIQWPAMVVTVVAAWMVGSQRKFKRNWGFWLFLFSNVLWILWGWHDHAYDRDGRIDFAQSKPENKYW